MAPAPRDLNRIPSLLVANYLTPTSTPLVVTGVSLTNARPMHVAMVDGTGNQITSFTTDTSLLATSAKQDIGNASLTSIDGKTPALGQALAANSTPVVLTAAQISTLTPLTTIPVTNVGTFAVQATLQTQTDTVMVGGVNIKEINAVAPLMGNGVTGTGSQRVTIASDNTAFSVNATLSAETTKVIGTVNQGTSPWVVAGGLTNNNAAPGATNVGALTGIANAAQQTWTEGREVLLSTNLRGAMRGIIQDAALNDRGANVTASNELNVLPAQKDTFPAAVAFTHTIASLANSTAGVGRQSNLITGNTAKSALIAVKFTVGTSPTANTLIYVYLLRGDATLTDDNAGASDAGITIINAPLLGTILCSAATSNVTYYGLFDTKFLGSLGPSFGIAIVNSTGVAANATGGNHVSEYTTIT